MTVAHEDRVEAAKRASPLLREFEGFRAKPYRCPKGKWTIGYGTTMIEGSPVTPNTAPVTRLEAEELMQEDMVRFQDEFLRLIRVPLTVPQLAGLTSFVYNIGTTKFRTSTMLKFLNAGRYDDAAGQFMVWVYVGLAKSNGLIRRRAREQALFLNKEGL